MYIRIIVAVFFHTLTVVANIDNNNINNNKKSETNNIKVNKNTNESKPISLTSVMDRNIRQNLKNSLEGVKCNGPNCKLSSGNNVESMKNGSNFLIIKHFCLNHCGCWPLWAFSITYFICHIIIFIAFFNSSAYPFTNGIWGKSFYTQGGLFLIIFSLISSIIGGLIGYYQSLCIPVILALIGGSLNLGASIVLVGKRGGSLGLLSCAFTGFIVTWSYTDDIFIIILITLICAICGLILGLIPFCKNFKMNLKYIEKCERLEYFNNFDSNDSINSEESTRSRLLRAKTVGSNRPNV